MTDCVVCIRRDTDYTVCRGCRLRLAADLGDLPNLYALLPYALQRSDQANQFVSGTPDPPTPVNLDVLNFLAGGNANTTDTRIPAIWLDPDWTQVTVSNGTKGPRVIKVRDRRPMLDEHGNQVYIPAGDQDDELLPPAVLLDQWVTDWLDFRTDKGENRPQPTVTALAAWLRIRLDWACDHHPAVDEFAHEIHDLTTRLRNLLALKRRVEVLQGAACPTCDTRSLFRTLDPREGASDWIECGNCHRLWTDSEYDRLVTILAADNTRSVTT